VDRSNTDTFCRWAVRATASAAAPQTFFDCGRRFRPATRSRTGAWCVRLSATSVLDNASVLARAAAEVGSDRNVTKFDRHRGLFPNPM
jgi:hypothetical protein